MLFKKIKNHILLIGLVLLSSACMQPRDGSDIAAIQKQVADMNQKLEETHHRLSVIQFMVDNQQRIISDFEKGKSQSIGVTDLKDIQTETPMKKEKAIKTSHLPNKTSKVIEQRLSKGSEVIEDVEKIYSKGIASYNASKYKEALSLFRSIIQNYPSNDICENAFYWKGECLYALKNYSEAILAFKQVVENYPKGRKNADALLKLGFTYISIKDNSNAKIYLRKVIKNYPFSKESSRAEEKLKMLK